jgi:hypothetical protein
MEYNGPQYSNEKDLFSNEKKEKKRKMSQHFSAQLRKD